MAVCLEARMQREDLFLPDRRSHHGNRGWRPLMSRAERETADERSRSLGWSRGNRGGRDRLRGAVVARGATTGRRAGSHPPLRVRLGLQRPWQVQRRVVQPLRLGLGLHDGPLLERHVRLVRVGLGLQRERQVQLGALRQLRVGLRVPEPQLLGRSLQGLLPLEHRPCWLPSAFCGFRPSRCVAPRQNAKAFFLVAPCDTGESLEILGPPTWSVL